jgi:signal peptidase I
VGDFPARTIPKNLGPDMAETTSTVAGNRPMGTAQSDSKTSPADKVVKKNAKDQPQPDSFRELVEAIAVAFMLAFVFKTFLAEAFIIPTGSMAPTLQGRHNDIFCEKCGYEYRTGAPEDRDNTGPLACPNCRFSMDLDIPANLDHQTFPGDKILVNKFIYDFTDPQRFDVIVFKFPEDSKTNYIKRLVGLPGEILKIEHGDIFVTMSKDKQFAIARKPNATKMQAMLQDVYVHDNLSEELSPNAASLRWQDWSGSQAMNHWQPSEDKKSFTLAAPNPETTWLRYQHLVPTPADWNDAKNKKASIAPAPSLIKDEYAYNIVRELGYNPYNYVGDLALECNVQADQGQGSLTFELVAGGRQFQAVADLATGIVELKIPAVPNFKVTSKSKPFAKGGDHKVLFANVDLKLWLIVDGTEVEFDKEAVYDLPYVEGSDLVKTQPGQAVVSDLSPVGIGIQGAKNAKVEHLKLMRDVYYTSMPKDKNSAFINASHSEAHLLKDEKDPLKDQFFMCGDNSPNSLDSRLWPQQFFVERRNLIGKATYVFWPHSWPTGISKKFDVGLFSIDVPFWPNFSRMRLIR